MSTNSSFSFLFFFSAFSSRLYLQIKALPRKASHFVISVQVFPDKKGDEEYRTVLWHFDTPPPEVNSPVTVLCNLPYIKFEVTLN